MTILQIYPSFGVNASVNKKVQHVPSKSKSRRHDIIRHEGTAYTSQAQAPEPVTGHSFDHLLRQAMSSSFFGV